jgi:hypothetical protein
MQAAISVDGTAVNDDDLRGDRQPDTTTLRRSAVADPCPLLPASAHPNERGDAPRAGGMPKAKLLVTEPRFGAFLVVSD